MASDIAQRADFSEIRYAQCWEDADVLLEALDIQPGDHCLSIASAGDNALAMLTRNPASVVAVDLSLAQLHCVELRVAAYRTLEHTELLELIGSSPSDRRLTLYSRCRPLLSVDAQRFWDAHRADIERGCGDAGKFERYFAMFRTRMMPLIHSRTRVDRLLKGGDVAERRDYYEHVWNTWRWRLLFKIFFSRFMMGRLGRDPEFFAYVEGSVAERILTRAKYALTELNPAENAYLQWILTGHHVTALPLALRPEHFNVIRGNLDRLTWRQCSIDAYLREAKPRSIHRFNLSDIFEYVSPEAYRTMLEALVQSAAVGGRLAFWNMLAPRSRPVEMADRLRLLNDLARELHAKDRAFFYSALKVEEVIA